MAVHVPSRCGQTFTVAAGDEIDLGNEFYRVWVQHRAAGGSDISVAPGEGKTGDRSYGLAASVAQNQYTRIAPDFPTKYVLVGSAGEVFIHWADAVRRSM